MRVLGLIPARGGSKAVPRKNLTLLAGRPLLAYTCDAARGSRLLDRIIVSTDDDEIATVARQEGVEVPFMRPPDLAADDTAMIDVVRHAVTQLESHGYQADAVAVLQPTSPLRTASDIDRAIELLESSGADTVVSVVRVPHRFTPGSLMRLEGGYLIPNDSPSAPLRRQDKPLLFARNGPAVLIVRKAAIDAGSFYGASVAGLEMNSIDSLDLDTLDDFADAEFQLSRRVRHTC